VRNSDCRDTGLSNKKRMSVLVALLKSAQVLGLMRPSDPYPEKISNAYHVFMVPGPPVGRGKHDFLFLSLSKFNAQAGTFRASTFPLRTNMSESESDFMLDELDGSEPTDPEFDADNDQKISRETRSKGKKKEGGMILRDALKVPRATSYSTEALHSAFICIRLCLLHC
jgi:hypothetical protein